MSEILRKQKEMLETKNKEITNKSIKIENLQKGIKSIQQSRTKKSGKNDQLRKSYIDAQTRLIHLPTNIRNGQNNSK